METELNQKQVFIRCCIQCNTVSFTVVVLVTGSSQVH